MVSSVQPHRCTLSILLGLALVILLWGSACAETLEAEQPSPSRPASFLAQVKSDYSLFYSKKHLTHLGLGLLAGGVMANTAIDQELFDEYQDWYRNDFGGTNSYQGNDFWKDVKHLGDGALMVPLAFSATLASEHFFPESADRGFGLWSRRVSRAYMVGFPPMLVLQRLTGGGRPNGWDGSGWSEPDSSWRPLESQYGLSGHSFIGSVPFLTLARMSENPFAKGLWITTSFLVPISRVTDTVHYFSQAFLGWFLAWEATAAVSESDAAPSAFTITPLSDGRTSGLLLSWRF